MKKIILDAAEVTTLVERMAIDVYQQVDNINNIALVGIKSRGDKLALRLQKLLHNKMKRALVDYSPIPLGALDINFYRDDLKQNYDTPKVNGTEIDFDVAGKHLILVDDVFYTGRTVRAALDAIFERGRPAKISMLTLIKRPGRELPVLPEFIGLSLHVTNNEYVKVELSEVEGVDCVSVFPR
jgi:pyrimidine operon attenuation protein/uracil phosphoribosyltransferase